MVVRVTERERATILAALRPWLSYPAAREADATATNRGKHKPLDDGEIQRLCKRIIEMAGSGNGAPVRLAGGAISRGELGVARGAGSAGKGKRQYVLQFTLNRDRASHLDRGYVSAGAPQGKFGTNSSYPMSKRI